MKRLVVIGNGLAGIQFVERLLLKKSSHFEIIIIGNEPAYKRYLLSRVLQQDIAVEKTELEDDDWYKQRGIRLVENETAVMIDPLSRQVKTDRGRKIAYDTLVLATGANPHVLPVKGAGKNGVMTFRSMNDCKVLMDASKHYRKAAVIGAGILGLETAMGLVHQGIDTTVVHHQPNVMNRQLDRLASEMLQEDLETLGMKFALCKRTKEINGEANVQSLTFSDGTSLEIDLVLMAVGVKPNVELAKKSGLEVHRGILVDDYLQTSDPSIYAIGECAEHRDVTYGVIEPILDQAEHLAATIAGCPKQYHGSIPSTTLNISGISLFSAGQVLETDDTRTYQWIDPIRHIYKKIVTLHGHVIGAILYGDTSESAVLAKLVTRLAPVSDIPSNQLFPKERKRKTNLTLVPRRNQVNRTAQS
ncbi:NAD(P)/FAD-dependent oxidoreductase [Bacillus sp. RAR_GA_16]|uniref:NAD(P)/FAD-dependent oxidoreductase n=1 Tax=Bacillus sp. RAR_GA_16 TaxID=2876774 RepID=UPI001CCC7681|nr:FAD-dependent oxidoreductase [Bacillus sp. RAR_GA_16]MCA0172585.1 FAD-dependent oxidoreductase [Bacillus sp. RAR_GA_16]